MMKPVAPKTPLSQPLQFLLYIADLLFTAFVLIVLLLAVWGLHYFGDSLRMTRFVFFLRIFELAVVSFGTFWCVLFLLKTTSRFIKNLNLQLQKPIKQVGGKLLHLHLGDIVKRFIEPVSKQPFSFALCSMVVYGFLYVGISFAEITRDDSDDVSMLACELLCETGPDFSEPVDNHVVILEDYAKFMKNKHKYLAGLLKNFSGHSPEEVLETVSKTLTSAKGSQEELANDIWRAGEEIMLGRLKAPKFLPRRITFHEYRKAPEWLLNDAAEALKESEKASMLFDEKPTMENAVKSCMANRRTVLLLFLARSSYNRPEFASLFTRFREVVEACRNSNIEIANRIQEEDDPQKEFLEIIAKSEQRRLDILDYIKNRNMQEAIERMWDAIEIAYSRKDKLLRLCAKIRKIRSDENYSEQIAFLLPTR